MAPNPAFLHAAKARLNAKKDFEAGDNKYAKFGQLGKKGPVAPVSAGQIDAVKGAVHRQRVVRGKLGGKELPTPNPSPQAYNMASAKAAFKRKDQEPGDNKYAKFGSFGSKKNGNTGVVPPDVRSRNRAAAAQKFVSRKRVVKGVKRSRFKSD